MAYTDLYQRSVSVHSYFTQVTLLQTLAELELLEKNEWKYQRAKSTLSLKYITTFI